MCRYLDQVNITNAFSMLYPTASALVHVPPICSVLTYFADSGMKEDLSLYGRELNYANAVWAAAYVIGQVPSNLLLTRVGLQLSNASDS